MTCVFLLMQVTLSMVYAMLMSRLAHGAIVNRRQGLIRARSIVCEVN